MITLSSDFPAPYPAAMRGVVHSRTDARVVDVVHGLPRHDVHAAAFWLREVLPWFPPAVHVVVVDPGVGTDRAALAVRAMGHCFIGPDNGVLVPMARRIDPGFEVFEVTVEDPASSTFHGRDVFAPTAADVHDAGVHQLEDLAVVSSVDSFVDYSFPDPRHEGDSVVGEILVVDGFGNAITNVPGEVLDDESVVSVNGDPVPVAASYAAVDPGERVVTVGSHGTVELAVNRGRGDDAFAVARGDEVTLVMRA